MNDIERLENLIKRCDECGLFECIECEICWTEVQAIKNLLKERQSDKEKIKELEENNQQLEKWLNYYKLGNTAEEFEELFGNTSINDIEKIKKYIFKNYIPKSLIKKEIEELEKEIKCEENEKVLIRLHKQKRILEKLLNENM